MSVNRRIGLGFTLAVDPAGGTTFTTLGAIVDGVKDGDAKADLTDISILTDVYKPKAKGQVDAGEAKFTIAYDPDEATSTTLTTMLGTIPAAPPNWQISFPAGTLGAGTTTTKTFQGHLIGMGREIMRGKLVTAELTIGKSGNPGM